MTALRRWPLCTGAALAVAVLAGCLPIGPTASASDAASNAPGKATSGVRLAGGSVVIAGPAGYCVDPVGTRDGARGAFALLGSCAALNGEGRPPARRAALTAAISPAGRGPSVAGSVPDLVAFFGSRTGRAMLSRSGDADTVTLLSSRERDGVLYLKLRDTSPFEGAETAEDYWRAVFDVGPRVVTLSVIPFRATPLSDSAAQALLEEFLGRVRAENAPRPATEAAPEGTESQPPPRPATAPRRAPAGAVVPT